jgi:hypothetical protein
MNRKILAVKDALVDHIRFIDVANFDQSNSLDDSGLENKHSRLGDLLGDVLHKGTDGQCFVILV